MKILFTGASSFTGFWFVQALAAAGHDVVCPITRGLENYTGTRRERMEKLQPISRLVADAPFGSTNFIKLAGAENFDLLCQHAATVTNYKSPDFDAPAAVQNNTHNLSAVLAAMRGRGLKAVVLTGTYFEAGEGAGSEPLRTFSPYSLSKTLTFEVFKSHCLTAGLPLGKFVIPNPFGPLEEPRFTAFLVKNWKAGQPCEVKTPDYLRDNIHVELLAAAYVQFATQAASAKAPLLKTNPSGYVEIQGAFAQRVARELSPRTGWKCELILAQQTDFSEPLNRTNTEPAVQFVPDWSESKAWDRFAEYYMSSPAL